MQPSHSKNPEIKNSGVLKTTTWGTLIALSLLIAGLGLTGHLSPTGGARHAVLTAANIAPERGAGLSSGALSSREFGSARRATNGASSLAPQSGAIDNRGLTSQMAAQANGNLFFGKSSSAAIKDQAPAQQNPGAGGLSNGSATPQAIIAAKIAPDLQGIDPQKPVDVIVQYKKSAGSADLSADGAAVKSDLSLIHAQLVTVQGSSLSSLASHSEVAYISPDRKLRGAMDPVVTAVNADIAYANGWNGTGVGIAVIDSGVSYVSDLNSDGNAAPSRVVYNQSFVPGDTSLTDAYGHGTHVAGIIAGNAYSSTQQNYPNVYRGIAPEANIISLRVLDSTGASVDSAVIAAIQQAISLQSTYNIRVINLSLSRGVFESYTLDPLCQAVESAWQAGIVVVAAAGNMGEYNGAGTQGYATIGAPGNDPYVITVGATNTHGTGSQSSQTVTSYSSKGPTTFDHIVKPDLVAPGNAVISLLASPNTTLITEYPALAVYPCSSSASSCGPQYGSANYMTMSGTSMATPVVSGVVALLVQQNPSLTPDQVKARLMKTAWKGFGQTTTATDLGSGVTYTIEQDMFAVGAGAVDASAALSNTDLAPATYGSAMSPAAVYDSNSGSVTITGAPGTVWTNGAVWGNSVVGGSSVVGGTPSCGAIL